MLEIVVLRLSPAEYCTTFVSRESDNGVYHRHIYGHLLHRGDERLGLPNFIFIQYLGVKFEGRRGLKIRTRYEI